MDAREQVCARLEARFGLARFPPAHFARTLEEVLGARDPEEACTRLLARPDEGIWERFAERLAIGETYFFREVDQLHTVVRHLQGLRRPARVWSLACSSGEEPYSIAMLCDRAGILSRVEVAASDLNRGALAQGRGAIYRPWSLRAVRDDTRAHYFRERSTGDFALCDTIRRAVSFSHQNLVERFPTGVRFDVLLCRNVFIYFERKRATRVVSRLADLLVPGGLLVLDPTSRTAVELPPGCDDDPGAENVGVLRRRLPTRSTPTPQPRPKPAPPPPPPTPPPPAPAVAPCATATPVLADPRETLAEGARALERGDLAQAATCVARARAESPEAPEPYLLAGELALAERDFEAARNAFRAAVFLDADSPHGRVGLAESLQRLGRNAAAVGQLEQLGPTPPHDAADPLATIRGDLDLRVSLLRRGAP